MHTTDVGVSEKHWVIVIHNGAWDGEAILRWGHDVPGVAGGVIDGEVTIHGDVARLLASED